MNILLITVRADHGGGPKHVDLLINNLSPNINIYLACPADEPYYSLWTSNEKVKEIFVVPHRKFSLIHFSKLLRFCINNNISLVHSHGKGAGIYSRCLNVFFNTIEVVHTFHGIQIDHYKKYQQRVYLMIERSLTRFTKKFINVSFGEKDKCINYNFFKEEQSEVIYNAISPLTIKKCEGEEFSLLKKKFVVTTISRFDYAKNMKLAYKIAKSFGNHKDILFLWIGDGQDKEELQKQTQKDQLTNIVFTGFKTNVEKYLSCSDIYLSTSRWEGLPYVLIESASIGLPIIATNVVGNNEVVKDQVNGYLFDSENLEVAIEKIKILYNNRCLYDKLAAESFRIYKENFMIENMISKIEVIYQNLHK
jgi:glycosyltransferase involved in cell wall biosynthesis